ncbi:MAG: hypothetical protein ISS77_08355 [Phycisphaerae bacterium]|nr:hypothetical protein [Phycisphaerae bacterium]
MNKGFGKFVGALFVYACFSAYLFWPYFNRFSSSGWENYFLAISPVFASLGCFLICKRWVGNWVGCFLAGGLYGFGPYFLSLCGFGPAAGLLASTIPWLFWPATFAFKKRFKWLRVPLALLPFAALVVFFVLDEHFRLFLIPTQTRLKPADIFGLIAPFAMVKRSAVMVGIYHVAIGPAIIGAAMMIEARRLWPAIIFTAGLALGLIEPVLGVSSVMWLSIPVLCMCVMAGIGMGAISEAGVGDKKWLLGSSIALAGLCIATLLYATKLFGFFASLADDYANALATTAKIYLVGSLGISVIFFMVRAKIRQIWIRWAILSICVGVDIILSASYIVDRLF